MSSSNCDLCFYALGDWGNQCPETKALASAMNKYAEESKRGPDFILALGDNFYPNGVQSVDDPHFQKSWSNIFLSQKQLRVPWKVVLGNHDYMGNYQAQIDFTTHANNVTGLWECPAQNYSFSHTIETGDGADPLLVDFFALDTNGCQGHVRRSHPGSQQALFGFKEDLRERLNKSRADYKIVFAHHPMYTIGRNHGLLGRCLRAEVYDGNLPGYGLESVLVEGGAHAYFTGHEHCMQHHHAKGVHHFVCGATGAVLPELYGGLNLAGLGGDLDARWFDTASPIRTGFAVAVVSSDAMTVRFVGVDGDVLREVVVPRTRIHDVKQHDGVAQPSPKRIRLGPEGSEMTLLTTPE